MASESTEKVNKELLREQFDSIDEDKNGSLSREELLKFATTLPNPLSEAEVNKIFRHMDVNGDQEVSFTEFYEWWTSKQDNTLNLLYFKQNILKKFAKAHKQIEESQNEQQAQPTQKAKNIRFSIVSDDSVKNSEISLKICTDNGQAEFAKTARAILQLEESQPCVMIKLRVSSNQSEAKEILEDLVQQAKDLVECILPPDLADVYLSMVDIKVTALETNFLLLSISSSHPLIEGLMQTYKGVMQLLNPSEENIELDINLSNSMNFQEMCDQALEITLLGKIIKGLNFSINVKSCNSVFQNVNNFLFKQGKQELFGQIFLSLMNGISISIDTSQAEELFSKVPIGPKTFQECILMANQGLNPQALIESLPIFQEFISFFLNHIQPDLGVIVIAPNIFAELSLKTIEFSSFFNKLLSP